MAEPSKKAHPIAELLEAQSGRTTAITNDVCVRPPFGCGKPATAFRDELSRKEYSISGLCQSCQDRIFGSDE
jgi:hypothetical protein